MKEEWFASVREDTSFYLDCRIRRFDGAYRWFRTLATPIRDSNGIITKWCGSHTDIEDCKRSEESYRMDEERLRLAQQVTSIGTFEWDVRTGNNVWTPELEAMYGLEPGSFGKTQESWEQLVHPEDRNAAIDRVQLAFDTSAPVEGEWRVLWPDGSVHWNRGAISGNSR